MLIPKFFLKIREDPKDSKQDIICRMEPDIDNIRLLSLASLTREISEDGVFSIGAMNVSLDASGSYNKINPRWLMSNKQLEGTLCDVGIDMYDRALTVVNQSGNYDCSGGTMVKSVTETLLYSSIMFSGFIEGPIEYSDSDISVSFIISTMPLSNGIGLRGLSIW